jgi:hypothetical protein
MYECARKKEMLPGIQMKQGTEKETLILEHRTKKIKTIFLKHQIKTSIKLL